MALLAAVACATPAPTATLMATAIPTPEPAATPQAPAATSQAPAATMRIPTATKPRPTRRPTATPWRERGQSIPVSKKFTWETNPSIDRNGFLTLELRFDEGVRITLPDARLWNTPQYSNIHIYPENLGTGWHTVGPIFTVISPGFEPGPTTAIARTYRYNSETRTLRVEAQLPPNMAGKQICIWSGGEGNRILGCGRIQGE